jgi:ubiquinone/menaquinone biosynthesis C-methylase UbiE
MRVVRDFEQLYRNEADPWNIGDALSPRYDRYFELTKPYARGAILDIGSGMGAFLARFHGLADSYDGIDISSAAVEKGRQRFPFITFHAASASELDDVTSLKDRSFDLIICSDVIYYLSDAHKNVLLDWIDRHLKADGIALIAAWCPGGKYLTPSEFVQLTRSRLVIKETEHAADSGHVAMICRRRRRFAAITVDYETWHPIPVGKHIDWQVDVFAPTEKLFDLCKRTDIAMTLFAEMGEYFWLDANDPPIARRMEEQWRKAVSLGHDVQLHLHPCWLPETGALKIADGWYWDWAKAKADDYPGDLTALIKRCKTALEAAIRPVAPTYEVTCFRAGAYQAQPFERLSQALIANGILCDSSVHPRGKNDQRGYDYATPYTHHQPYFADLLDPQLKAVPAEEQIIELPIFTPEPGQRWFIDGTDGARLASRLLAHERRAINRYSISKHRLLDKTRKAVGAIYALSASRRRLVNRLLPRAVSYSAIANDNPRHHDDRYFVAIGHTKADLDWQTLERNIRSMTSELRVEFITLSDMARRARDNLLVGRRTNAADEIRYQVEREHAAILGEQRNEAQSYYLQDMIPLDVERILDFGCGSGYWSHRIASLYPWVDVVGIDAGKDFIDKANSRYGSERVTFELGDFARLEYGDGSFDCVYADNTLEHSFDIDAGLNEIYRVLKVGGSLVAALPVDGLNPEQVCDNHTWKTVRAGVIQRLERAGFVNIFTEEIDTYRHLGMPPYMPSNDRMLYIRAWKIPDGENQIERARRAMAWLYRRVEPLKPNLSESAVQIISDKYGYCIAYSVALGQMLKREGYDVTWVTMKAENHERGSGPKKLDAHEVIEVKADGQTYVLDPMANTCFASSIDNLIATPVLANSSANRDERCQTRGYQFYNTAYWYERVATLARRKNVHLPVFFWRRARR